MNNGNCLNNKRVKKGRGRIEWNQECKEKKKIHNAHDTQRNTEFEMENFRK